MLLLLTDIGSRIRAKVVEKNILVLSNNITLEKVLDEPPVFSPRNNSLFRSLSYGIVRWHYRLEWQVEQLITKNLNPNDKKLKSLLRLGLFQLQFTRIPHHAAVSETVNTAEILGISKTKGLVNAVLRRFLREREKIDTSLCKDPQAFTSHPKWMVDLIKKDWPDSWKAIINENNLQAPMWIRVNERKVKISDYLCLLEKNFLEYEYILENNLLRLKKPIPAKLLPNYEKGWVSIQDGAAQLAFNYLDIKSGDRILDACAAPGGKSAHILEACKDIKELVSVDINNNRLDTMRENLDRLGLKPKIICGDACSPTDWWDGNLFDKIILDAPCSSIGVIRRHPDIKVLRNKKDIENVACLQENLLKSLWPLLKPGGTILYSTCSIIYKENQERVTKFVNEISDAYFNEEIFGGESYRQILPGENNMDGFFYSSIKKVIE
mgnify:CR=1 FL=1